MTIHIHRIVFEIVQYLLINYRTRFGICDESYNVWINDKDSARAHEEELDTFFFLYSLVQNEFQTNF